MTLSTLLAVGALVAASTATLAHHDAGSIRSGATGVTRTQAQEGRGTDRKKKPTPPRKKPPPKKKPATAPKKPETTSAPTRSAPAAAARKPGPSAATPAPARRDTAPARGADTVAPKLIWPVTGRTILQPYGERTNPTTGTVTMNPGIDIAAPRGSSVRAAAAGTVSLVHWLPGYGTLVIVEHRGGYRTVYANLESATVSRGSAVKQGDRVGRAGRRGGREFVHFEVWRGNTSVDPGGLLPAR